MIVQLTGVKRIHLHSETCEQCHPFGVTLKAGDICKIMCECGTTVEIDG